MADHRRRGRGRQRIEVEISREAWAVAQALADMWGRLSAKRSVPVTDALLAATAQVHGLMLVTRNAADVAGLGVAVLNPFEPSPPPRRE